MEGWIKIHRQIKEHWIWDNSMYLKAWLGILLTVNHDDKKILIQGELIECKRGQSILSLAGWVRCFGKRWTMQRIRTFFELLKKDQMIITEGLRKTTRLTVCNYDNYQFEQQAKNKQRTSKEQADNNEITTNKNEEERIKNEKNEEELRRRIQIFKDSIFLFKNQYSEIILKTFFDYWSEMNKSKSKMKFELQQTFEISKRLATWKRNDDKFDKNNNKTKFNSGFQLSEEDKELLKNSNYYGKK
jgi:hypothetical protein